MITLDRGKIVDQWATLLDQCQGEGEGVFRAVEDALKGSQAPDVRWTRETVAPGFWAAVGGKRRDFLIVRNDICPYHLLAISAHDYGTGLDVSWYLVDTRGGPVRKFLEALPIVGGFFRALWSDRFLDVFDEQELRAYMTVGHRAVRRGIEELIARRKLEVDIDWKSRGAFGLT